MEGFFFFLAFTFSFIIYSKFYMTASKRALDSTPISTAQLKVVNLKVLVLAPFRGEATVKHLVKKAATLAPSVRELTEVTSTG